MQEAGVPLVAGLSCKVYFVVAAVVSFHWQRVLARRLTQWSLEVVRIQGLLHVLPRNVSCEGFYSQVRVGAMGEGIVSPLCYVHICRPIHRFLIGISVNFFKQSLDLILDLILSHRAYSGCLLAHIDPQQNVSILWPIFHLALAEDFRRQVFEVRVVASLVVSIKQLIAVLPKPCFEIQEYLLKSHHIVLVYSLFLPSRQWRVKLD